MTMQTLFNEYRGTKERSLHNASDLLPIPSYWQEYPDRDREYVRWYPHLMGYMNDGQIWNQRHVPVELEPHARRAAFYLHIPFCNQHCESCPYSKFMTQGRLLGTFVDALKREIETYGRIPYMQELTFEAGYFGGGTPTSLKTAFLVDLIRHLRRHLVVPARCHLTIETTPFEMNEEKAQTLRDEGFVRVSIGVQSFDERNLKILGRTHGAREVVHCVRMLQRVGYDEINVDLMYGLAGENMASWRRTIDAFLAAEIDSVSLYRFILIPFSALFRQILAGSAPPPPSEQEAEEMYEYAMERLFQAGYVAVTPKDFIKRSRVVEADIEGRAEFFDVAEGREAVLAASTRRLIYPTTVWYEECEHLPLGPGSVGFLNRHYFVNEPNIGSYIKLCSDGRLPPYLGTYVPAVEKQAMSLVMGSKLLRVRRKDFRERHGEDMVVKFGPQIEKLVSEGLVTFDDEALTVTYPKGFAYTDNISKTFYTPKHYRVPQPNVDNTLWLQYIRPSIHSDVQYDGKELGDGAGASAGIVTASRS
jgi:oxygen-independent coproporphyrinogen-3 oxidase